MTNLIALAVTNRLASKLIHHGLAHLVTCTAPDVDDLVVALALGDKPRGILLLDFLNLGLSTGKNIVLLCGDEHVVYTDRNASTRSQRETRLQKLVRKNDGVTQSATSERGVNKARDFFLLERLIH